MLVRYLNNDSNQGMKWLREHSFRSLPLNNGDVEDELECFLELGTEARPTTTSKIVERHFLYETQSLKKVLRQLCVFVGIDLGVYVCVFLSACLFL